MFGHRYLGSRYFGGRFFGDGGNSAPAGATAAQIWNYVLSNGKTAGQNLVENNTMLLALTANPGGWGQVLEGTYTAADLLRIIAAVAAGQSRITNLGGGNAHVEFDAVDASEVRVAAEMTGSERTSLTLTP